MAQTAKRKRSAWMALAIGAAAAVLGGIFVWLGLERADQLASVLGTFVGLAGLGVSVYGVILARRASQASGGAAAAVNPATPAAATGDSYTALGERSVVMRDNSGVIQTGDDSTAQR